MPGLTAIAAGGLHALAVADSQILAWGWNKMASSATAPRMVASRPC
jgi:hypothetical protein